MLEKITLYNSVLENHFVWEIFVLIGRAIVLDDKRWLVIEESDQLRHGHDIRFAHHVRPQLLHRDLAARLFEDEDLVCCRDEELPAECNKLRISVELLLNAYLLWENLLQI